MLLGCIFRVIFVYIIMDSSRHSSRKYKIITGAGWIREWASVEAVANTWTSETTWEEKEFPSSCGLIASICIWWVVCNVGPITSKFKVLKVQSLKLTPIQRSFHFSLFYWYHVVSLKWAARSSSWRSDTKEHPWFF